MANEQLDSMLNAEESLNTVNAEGEVTSGSAILVEGVEASSEITAAATDHEGEGVEVVSDSDLPALGAEGAIEV
jgi:hypothetical protein